MITLIRYARKQAAASGSGRNDGDAASRGSYTLPTQQQYHQQKPSATSLPKGGESPRVFVDSAEVYDSNYGGRTPSPTPEEVDFLTKKGGLSWEKLSNPRWWLQKDVIIRIVVFAIIIASAVLIGVFKDKIVTALTPAGHKIKSWPAGFLIPVAILIVISFPPLAGHELILLLLGIFYGLWVGFAIACAGTLIGEILNYFVFKYWCTARSQKQEKKNLKYEAFATLIREGGFMIILAARLSILPSHITTTLFASCGVSFLEFVLAAVLALPKQLALVYLGVLYDQSGNGETSHKGKGLTVLIFTLTGIITVMSWRYMMRRLAVVKEQVVYRRRKERQAKLASNRSYPAFVDDGGVYAPQARAAAQVASPMMPVPSTESYRDAHLRDV